MSKKSETTRCPSCDHEYEKDKAAKIELLGKIFSSCPSCGAIPVNTNLDGVQPDEWDVEIVSDDEVVSE